MPRPDEIARDTIDTARVVVGAMRQAHAQVTGDMGWEARGGAANERVPESRTLLWEPC